MNDRINQAQPAIYEKLGREKLHKALRQMHLIRLFEEGAEQAYMRGLVHGTMHLSIGQEASAVGVGIMLESGDYITSTHRGHGHCIAKGADPKFVLHSEYVVENRARGFEPHTQATSVLMAAMGLPWDDEAWYKEYHAGTYGREELFARQNAGLSEVDPDWVVEINEAFAAQAIGVNKQMGWDTAKINVNGGAIAIGHPIGASGCRILVTLLHEMIRRDAKRGLASLCIGGGMGVALAVER